MNAVRVKKYSFYRYLLWVRNEFRDLSNCSGLFHGTYRRIIFRYWNGFVRCRLVFATFCFWHFLEFDFDSIPGGVACAQGSPYRTSIRRIGSALGWTYSSIRVWCVIGGYLPAAEKILI